MSTYELLKSSIMSSASISSALINKILTTTTHNSKSVRTHKYIKQIQINNRSIGSSFNVNANKLLLQSSVNNKGVVNNVAYIFSSMLLLISNTINVDLEDDKNQHNDLSIDSIKREILFASKQLFDKFSRNNTSFVILLNTLKSSRSETLKIVSEMYSNLVNNNKGQDLSETYFIIDVIRITYKTLISCIQACVYVNEIIASENFNFNIKVTIPNTLDIPCKTGCTSKVLQHIKSIYDSINTVILTTDKYSVCRLHILAFISNTQKSNNESLYFNSKKLPLTKYDVIKSCNDIYLYSNTNSIMTIYTSIWETVYPIICDTVHSVIPEIICTYVHKLERLRSLSVTLDEEHQSQNKLLINTISEVIESSGLQPHYIKKSLEQIGFESDIINELIYNTKQYDMTLKLREDFIIRLKKDIDQNLSFDSLRSRIFDILPSFHSHQYVSDFMTNFSNLILDMDEILNYHLDRHYKLNVFKETINTVINEMDDTDDIYGYLNEFLLYLNNGTGEYNLFTLKKCNKNSTLCNKLIRVVAVKHFDSNQNSSCWLWLDDCFRFNIDQNLAVSYSKYFVYGDEINGTFEVPYGFTFNYNTDNILFFDINESLSDIDYDIHIIEMSRIQLQSIYNRIKQTYDVLWNDSVYKIPTYSTKLLFLYRNIINNIGIEINRNNANINKYKLMIYKLEQRLDDINFIKTKTREYLEDINNIFTKNI